MKSKRDKRDDVFSKLIRTRDGFTCQSCWKVYPENSQGLHCSHFWGRRHQSVRWHPDNACAHCFSCHQKLGENPIQFQAWIRSYLGDERYSELCFKAKQIVKRTKVEKEELYQHLKAELARLQELRAQGETGVLYVTPFD